MLNAKQTVHFLFCLNFMFVVGCIELDDTSSTRAENTDSSFEVGDDYDEFTPLYGDICVRGGMQED